MFELSNHYRIYIYIYISKSMHERGSRADKVASRLCLAMLLARLSRTIQIENNETNDCETLFPCALLEKDGEIERSRSKLSFASCYPLFHQHLSARSQRMRLGRGEGEQEFFAACLLPISCTSPDTSSLLTSRPSSLVSFLSPPVHAPISNSTPSSLFPSDPSLTTDLRPIH